MNWDLFIKFYTTERHGYKYLSHESGPFGFDIHHALEVQSCIDTYKPDVIVETGTCAGDTTEFLARLYPNILVISIEIDYNLYQLSKDRLRNFKNIKLIHGSSDHYIEALDEQYNFPFYYLDAHWYEHWPLADELSSINKGIVCIGDFDIQEPGYSFDNYKNQDCNQDIVLASCKPSTSLYINDIKAYHAWPNLAMKRRSGRCYFGIDTVDKFKNISYLKQMRGSSVEERRAHNPEVEGATPSSASILLKK